MQVNSTISSEFNNGLNVLGMNVSKSGLVFVSEIENKGLNLLPSEWFALEKAKTFGATAIYFRKFDLKDPLPQIYIYDFTNKNIDDQGIAEIHKKIWTNGAIPVAYIFFKTEIRILDCTKPVAIKNNKAYPVYLEKELSLIGEINEELKKYSAKMFDSGLFWDNQNLSENSDDSALIKLLKHLMSAKVELKNATLLDEVLIQKLLMQVILIKYLEERRGEDSSQILDEEFFRKFNGRDLCTVLRKKGEIINLINDLNEIFNGKIFEWDDKDKKIIAESELDVLANFLDGQYEPNGQISIWRQYSFNFLPIELISRIYEQFLDPTITQSYYTPPHLAKYLVDESMPLNIPMSEINLNFKILDPACGSGIFLVLVYKRLVQWWIIKNGFKIKPNIIELKKILKKNVFGIDKDEKAVQLTSFSLCLALCDLLNPKQIWRDLKFDDLREENVIYNDFFTWSNNNKKKYFDLVIGNPPFKRGKVNKEKKDHDNPKLTDNQICLNFLEISMTHIKPHGLQCLILSASSILYNKYSQVFRRVFFQEYNVVQILDFTYLARNKRLWDNADTATVAIFTKKEKPDSRNILHLVIKNSLPSKKKLYFEIDEYDYHYVTREDSLNYSEIWKLNLLGGGRLKYIFQKYKNKTRLKDIINSNEFITGEGFIEGSKKKKISNFMYNKYMIMPETITNEGFDRTTLILNKKREFAAPRSQDLYLPPNLIIKEVMDLPTYLNTEEKFIFSHSFFTIKALNNKSIDALSKIENYLKEFNTFNNFYLLCASYESLINKNSAVLKDDVLNLPYLVQHKFDPIEKVFIEDSVQFYQNLIRKPTNNIHTKKINSTILENYSKIFEDNLNALFSHKTKYFKKIDSLISESQVICVFQYNYGEEITKSIISNKISTNLKIKDQFFNLKNESSTNLRFIKIYKGDKIIIAKPNQIRYWLKSVAYRDSDKIILELNDNGY